MSSARDTGGSLLVAGALGRQVAVLDALDHGRVGERGRVTELLDPALRVVLLTARPQRVHELTEAWLARYRIRWDVLLMRPWGDYELSRDFKQSAVWDLRSFGFDLRLAIEDDRRNVDMFRAEGVPCIYFHSGYYD